jgi:hypothetical protein
MEIIFVLIYAALVIVPLWRLTEKAGYSPYWALAAVIPFGIIVLLWVIANRLAPSGSRGV